MSVLNKKIRIYFLIVMMATGSFVSAQTAVAPEYQIKAVFLYNFTQFVEWKSDAFTSSRSPFIIGIYGSNPFGRYLEETMTSESVNGHPLIIQYYQNIGDIKSCHILFINKEEVNNINSIIASLKGRNILTISDAPAFTQQGGMIKFYTKSSKIQLQINLDAVKMAKLDVSSKLLRLADIY